MSVWPGTWKSKTSDLEVKVIKVHSGGVWYEHPDWNGLQNCAEDVFEGSMRFVDPSESPTIIQFHRDQVNFGAFGL